MAKKKKGPVTPVIPQKTEDKPAQTAAQAPQKDTSCGQSSSGTTTPTTPKP